MRIILADHHTQALGALKTLILEQPELELIGEAVDADALLALAASESPDLALIDWELPGEQIEELISELHMHSPRPIVVVMSSQSEYGRMLLKAGADAFISKSDQPDWLLNILQKYAKKLRKEDGLSKRGLSPAPPDSANLNHSSSNREGEHRHG